MIHVYMNRYHTYAGGTWETGFDHAMPTTTDEESSIYRDWRENMEREGFTVTEKPNAYKTGIHTAQARQGMAGGPSRTYLSYTVKEQAHDER